MSKAFLILALALAAGNAPAQARYMRAWYIQYVPEGYSSTYGDCAFYEFPGEDGILDTADDRNLLMDGGRSSYAYNVLIPFLRERVGEGGTIWNLSVSSPGADHYGGLQAVADNFPVANYYENVRWPLGDKPSYDDLISALEAQGTEFFTYDAGDWLSGTETTVGPGWDPWIGARVLCANTDPPYDGADDNYWSGVIQIRCGQSVFLTGGDADGSYQETWIRDGTSPHSYPEAGAELADTDIYKVHHHGSKYSSSRNFMDLMSPRYAVVTVAYGDGPGSHSHPTKEALDRIWSAGGVVYRNDLDGTVLVKCDSEGNFDIVRARAYSDETLTPGGSCDLVQPPPEPPVGLRVTGVGEESVSLAWTAATSVYSCDVYRSEIAGGDPGAGRHAQPGGESTGIYRRVNSVDVFGNSFTDTSLVPGRTYHYRVAARQVYTQSGYQVCYETRYSNEVEAVTAGGKSPTPSPYGFHTPSPSSTPSATPTSSPTPSSTPTASPTPTRTPTPSATPSPSPTSHLGNVVINEILADVPYWEAGDANGDGEVSTWEDEFVEIVNRTGEPVPLGGAELSDSQAIRFVFSADFFLAPGAAAVVFGGGSPSGDFGGAAVFTVGTEFGLYLTNGGDTVTLSRSGEVIDSVSYGPEGGYDQSLTRSPELLGGFIHHTLAAGDENSLFSPGRRADGNPFSWIPTPSPTSTPTAPPPSPSPSPSITPTPPPPPSPSPTSSRTPSPSPAPSPTPSPSPSLTPSPTPAEADFILNEILADVPPDPEGDANRDGRRISWEDEFIEIVNRSADAADIGGYSIRDAKRLTYTFPENSLIGPGEALVVFGGGSPSGNFGDAAVFTVGTEYGLFLSNEGDSISLHDREGKIRDRVCFGDDWSCDQSFTRHPETAGPFVPHAGVSVPTGVLYSPGTRADGGSFAPSPVPSPTQPPDRTPTPLPSPSGTPTPVPTASPSATPSAPPSPTPTASPTPSVSPTASPSPRQGTAAGDYDGDGTSDIALFRPSTGLWLVRHLTRAWFGASTDQPVPRDYSGDGTWNIAIYRPSLGKWMVRGLTGAFYGVATDLPVPADYDGDGSADVALFRPAIGKWLVRDGAQVFYGFASDTTVPGDYDGDSTTDIAVFRPRLGKWLVKDGPSGFYGVATDTVVPGDYTGDGSFDFAVFRPTTGRWLVKDGPNAYWGAADDTIQPADYNGDGTWDFAVFRSSVGRWLIRGVTSAYYGAAGDGPVSSP